MKWDTVCRPTNDPFWTFLSPGAREPVHPQTIFVYFRQLKNILYVLGIHPKKIIIPASFHSKAFVLLYKFETSWALLGRLSRGFQFFFAISGASNLKQFKQLFMTLSGLGSLTMWQLPRWVSYLYLTFFKTILAALFRTFGLPLLFLLLKPSFLHDHFTAQRLDISSFLAVCTTDKPVNRSTHAYAPT